jgi:low temperature requirement protein LtrA
MQAKQTKRRLTWWQKPHLHTEEEEQRHRRVSWLELFYDLAFVALVAQLSHQLAAHISWEGLAGYLLLFLPVWWVWIAGTYYNERFETEGMESRVFTFLQMLPVAAMAVFAYEALETTGAQFALAYATARAFHVFLWALAGYYVPMARPMTNRFVAGFSVSILLFICSAFVEPPVRYWLWIGGLTFDLLTPVFTRNYQMRLPRISTSKYPERFGLFVIIMLGETVVGTVNGLIANHDRTWTVGVNAILGMALAFGLWWVYFDFVARRPAKPAIWWTMLWGYLHLPLVMGLVAIGAGTLVLVGNLGDAAGAKQLIAASVGVTLLVTGLLETTLRSSDDEPTHPLVSPIMKVLVGIVAMLLTTVSDSLSVPVLLLMLLALILTQIAYGIHALFTPAMPLHDTESEGASD